MDPMSRFSVVPSGDESPEGPARPVHLEQLLHRAATGDETAFAELYDAVSSRLFGLVRRVVRDPSKGAAMSWMLTIAHRKAVDRVRSAEAARNRDEGYGASNQDVTHDSTAEAVVERLDAERVHRALETLTPVQRQALEMAYLSGYTHTEVASMLDLPLGTAKTRIRDGLIRLRDTLGVTL